MEVIHTIWDNDNLNFWVESLDNHIYGLETSLSRMKAPSRDIYPSTRNFNQILKVLRMAGLENQYIPSRNTLDLFLHFNDESYSSIDSLRDIKSNNIERIPVDSIILDLNEAINFLLTQKNFTKTNYKISSSTKFWIQITEFVMKLISEQKYLPDVEVLSRDDNNIEFIGCWKAIILGNDKYELKFITQEMPLYCKTFNNLTLNSDELVFSYINKVIDVFIKNRIGVFLPPENLLTNEDRITSIARDWFKSLYTPEMKPISVNKIDYEHFAGIIQSWLRTVQFNLQETPFRLCFKLKAPEIDSTSQSWFLEYLLQAKNDPSLIIPAEEVWKYRASTLDFLEDRYENPQERLLNDLAHASEIYPNIEKSLNTAFPTGLNLDQSDAFRFIEYTLPALEENDFTVLLPSWWNNPQDKIGVKLSLPDGYVPTGKSMFCMHEFLKFDWQISIGDSTLSLEEFEKLASLRVPFVNIRNQWVKIDQEKVNTILEEIKPIYSKITFADALQESLIDNHSFDEVIDLTIDDKGLFSEFKTKIGSKSKIELLDTPNNFQGELRPYQSEGFAWINYLKDYGFGCCLADDMGLGKTIQIIAFLLHELNQDITGPNLLICPTSIVGNWHKEVQKFAPDISVLIHHGPNRFKNEEFQEQVQNADLVITTYNLAQRDKSFLYQTNFENIILDEAQNIKNPHAKQSRAIKKLNGNYRIALTGTPIENRLSELWSIMDFLNPGYLDTLKRFTDKFSIPIEKKNDSSIREKLTQIVQPFILRRLKTDPTIIQDLPEKMETKVYCSLKEEQAILYESVVKDLFAKLNNTEGIHRKGLVLSTFHVSHYYQEPRYFHFLIKVVRPYREPRASVGG